MHQLIDASVDWNKEVVFGAVCDWHIPGLLQLCRQRGNIKHNEICPLWELPQEVLPSLSSKDHFKSKSGHPLRLEHLGPEFSQLINDNWKFRDAYSVHWIRSQCESGLSYGVFPLDIDRQSSRPADDDVNAAKSKQPISWIIAYKYVIMIGLIWTSQLAIFF